METWKKSELPDAMKNEETHIELPDVLGVFVPGILDTKSLDHGSPRDFQASFFGLIFDRLHHVGKAQGLWIAIQWWTEGAKELPRVSQPHTR